MSDWTGNKNSIFKTLGASNHTDKERQNEDFYATHPIAAKYLLDLVDIPKDKPILEPSAGEKHLSNVFEKNGYDVISKDIVVRTDGVIQEDFLNSDTESNSFNGSIITNPPYKYASEFIDRAMNIVTDGNIVAMFLKIQFLEGKSRKALFKKYPPKNVFVSSSRIMCAKNGDFEGMKQGGGSAVAYAWFVWEKGYTGDTIIKWFN